MDNYMVVYKNLPHKVNAFTMYNAIDCYYTIVLNSRISFMTARKAFLHEIKHIENGDFDKYKSVAQIETLAHT